MSFSDMMQSGRGPGVIGMLLALLVVGGFGVLFLLAFNEEPPGDKLSLQAEIKEQAREIEEATTTLARHQQKLDVVPKLQAAELKLRDAKREILYAQGRIDSTKTGIVSAQQQLTEKAAEFEKYKDQYREAARRAAKDEELAKLETRSGQTYEKVVIREVTPVGMQIRHQGGFARIPFEDLPADLQDRFQFDPAQKAAALAKENAERKDHDTAVAATLTETKQQAEDRKQKEEADQKAAAKRAIALKTTQITTLDGDLVRLEIALQQEMQKKLKNTQAITSQIADKRRLRAQLQAEIAQLRALP